MADWGHSFGSLRHNAKAEGRQHDETLLKLTASDVYHAFYMQGWSSQGFRFGGGD